MIGNPTGVLLSFHPFGRSFSSQFIHCTIEVISRLLQNCLRIGIENRVLTTLNQLLIQFLHIGKIEISGYHEVFTRPVTFPKIRMAGIGTIFSRCTIAQMAQEDFPTIVKVLFNGFRKLVKSTPPFHHFTKGFVLSPKYFGQSFTTCATLPKHEGFPNWHIQFHRTNTRSILPAVVLLFHQ